MLHLLEFASSFFFQVADVAALQSQLDGLVADKEALRLENEQLRASHGTAHKEALPAVASQEAGGSRRTAEALANASSHSAELSNGAEPSPSNQGGREGTAGASSTHRPGVSSSEDLQRLSGDNRALRAKLDQLRSKSGLLLRSPGTPGALNREVGSYATPPRSDLQRSEIVAASSLLGEPPLSAESAGELIEDARLLREARTGNGSPFPVAGNGSEAGKASTSTQGLASWGVQSRQLGAWTNQR